MNFTIHKVIQPVREANHHRLLLNFFVLYPGWFACLLGDPRRDRDNATLDVKVPFRMDSTGYAIIFSPPADEQFLNLTKAGPDMAPDLLY